MPGTDAGFLNSFVHTLDRRERTLLMLYYVEQLTVDEISQILRFSRNDVEQTLRDIRHRTRNALQVYQPAAA